MSNTTNNITISGGQGVFPLAYIDTDRAFEVTYTSAQFTMDMFEMANTGLAEDKDIGVYESETYEVTAGEGGESLAIELPFEVHAPSTKIRGLEYAAEAGSGKFTVTVTPYSDPTPAKTVISFSDGDVVAGDVVTVTYKRRIVDAHVVSIKTTSTAAKGEVTMHFPVYSSGEDCSASSIKGVVHIRVPRMRVTAQPGFDQSYKTASTNAVSFAAIDPKRVDKKMCDIIYEEYNEDGTMKTEAVASTVDYT